MTTRVYVVASKEPGDQKLVRAASAAQAIRHVVADRYSATVAKQDDLVALLTMGAKVEDAHEGVPLL